ncbi:MAG: ATP-binding protein [Desulfurococcales archaeon]|nr:ATP-binding protein [Desulfurococcales archaeon]
MGFLDNVRVWGDVLDEALDEKAAPSLGEVHLGLSASIYSDPSEFFRRTLITRHMADALEGVAEALLGGGGSKLVMLQSLFGGGKTHTLLAIYHAFRSPAALLEAKAEDRETAERVRRLAEKISRAGRVRVVVVDGYFSQLAPTPVNPLEVPGGYRVRTVWGSIAHQLGRYGEVRENDERLLVPQADVIAGLLAGEPVLILIDEIAHYAASLKASGDKELRDYADQVISFMETLAKAVEISRRSALIVSLPVEERSGRIEVEERYKPVINVVLSIYKSVSRVASRRILPVAPRDIPNILRVRIFESISRGAARAVSASLARLYSAEENRDIFGPDAVRVAHRVAETYPFHPAYIDVLVDIVDKHEGLQKTRDAIRITRKVVRRLKAEGSNAELVMPFHIDVEDREIRGVLFHHPLYRQFEAVVSEDIAERTKRYDRPELAKTVAKTVLVRTFVYAGSTKHHQLYPDRHEAVLASFEPAMARSQGLQPKDYVDALEWAANNLVYMLSEGGRYWFTIIASPVRMVEMTARSIDDYDALREVRRIAEMLLTRSPQEIVSGRRRAQRRTVKSPFDVAASRVLTEPEPVDHDSRRYILLAVLSPLKDGEIERLIYELPNGGRRRYANTVYLVFPRDTSRVLEMLGFAKQRIACEKVEEELDLHYTDSEVREVMKSKLEKYCKGEDGVEGKLAVNVLQGLNTVAYPQYDEQAHRNTFGLAPTLVADTLVESATRALKSVKPQKLYDDLDFEILDHLLSRIGVHLSEGDSPKPVSDVIDYFYSNTRLPMATERAIEDALIDGVKKLMIGIRRGDKLFYKKVYECRSARDCKPPSVDEGEAPREVDPKDLVLPWRIALLEQAESLKGVREERIPGGLRRVWHAFYLDGELIPVDQALQQLDPDTLRYLPLVRITEIVEEGVDVKLDNYEITALPGEEVALTVLVERVGEYSGEIRLEATGGELNRRTLRIAGDSGSASVEWRIRAPEEPGTYSYELRVLGPSGEQLRSATLTLIVRPKGRERARGAPPRGAKISLIEVEVPKLNLKPLGILRSKLGPWTIVENAELELEAEENDARPRITICLNGVSLEDLERIFLAVVQRYNLLIKRLRYRIRLRPRTGNYIVAPELTEAEARELENYLTYYTHEGD